MYSTQLFAAFFAIAAIGWATLTQGAIIVARRDVCDNYECALSLRFSVTVKLTLASAMPLPRPATPSVCPTSSISSFLRSF